MVRVRKGMLGIEMLGDELGLFWEKHRELVVLATVRGIGEVMGAAVSPVGPVVRKATVVVVVELVREEGIETRGETGPF